jgi:hypothetical protein
LQVFLIFKLKELVDKEKSQSKEIQE